MTETQRGKRFRASHKIGVGFQGAGTRIIGEIVDISISGLLMRCEPTLPVGTIAQLAIETSGDTIRGVVRVSRIVAGVGMACKFTSLAPRDRQALDRFLSRLTSSSETAAPVAKKPPSQSPS